MENMNIEQLLQEQANVVHEMLNSSRNFTEDMVNNLTEIVDTLATKYKEEMEGYVTKATDEIRAIDPELLKRKDYDSSQHYYIGNRWLPNKGANDYSPAYIEPPRYLGNDNVQGASERFIKVEDLDKYKELVKNHDSVFKFRRDKLSPYRREATAPNTVSLNNALNELQGELMSRGFSAISVEPIKKDELSNLAIEDNIVRIEDIERQMVSSMSDLQYYIRQMGRENSAKYDKFRQYFRRAKAEGNQEQTRKSDLDYIVTKLKNISYTIEQINKKINNNEPIIDIFKDIKELHAEIKDVKNNVKDKEIYEYLDKWEKNLERFAKLGKEYIEQEEREKGRIDLSIRVQNEHNMVVDQNTNEFIALPEESLEQLDESSLGLSKLTNRGGGTLQEPIALPAAKTEKSYENMSLEELEELLKNKIAERDELYRVVSSAGDNALNEEIARYEQLNKEIKKIEEEIAKRKAKFDDPNKGRSEQTGPTTTTVIPLPPANDKNETKTGPEQTGPEQTEPTTTVIPLPPANDKNETKTGPEQTEPEFKVMLKKAWNWVKDHKKQILIIAGLAAIAIATVVALQGLIPAITAAIEANNVSTMCQAMFSNGAKWFSAIGSEKTALHGANTALASMIETMTGNKAVFDVGTGIWSFGQSGVELGAFAQEAALAAAKAAKKVTTLSIKAGSFGLGGLGLIGTGVLLQNRSAAYKAYKDEMKQCSNKLNNNMIIEFYGEIDILEQAISNDSRLSNEEKIKLLKKIKKLKLKASKVQLNTQKNPKEEVIAEEVNYEEEAQRRGSR